MTGDYFVNIITKDLELKQDNSSNEDTLEDGLKTFNAHPNIKRISLNIEINEKFSFQLWTEDLV